MTPPIWDHAMLGFSCFPEGAGASGLGFLPIDRSTNSEVLQEVRGPYSRNHRDFPGSAMILTAAVQSGYLRCDSAEDFSRSVEKTEVLASPTPSTLTGQRHTSKSHELEAPAVCQ